MENNEIPSGFELEDQSQPDSSIPEGFALDKSADLPEGFTEEGEKPDLSKYQTTGQQIATGLEAAARGATFGGSNWAETHLGISTPEDIANRQEANPGIDTVGNIAGMVGSTFIPVVGEGKILTSLGAKAAAKLTPIAADAGRLAKVGKGILQGAIKGGVELGGMQAGDELGKALIGKGNPSDVAALHIVGSGAGGMLLGGAGGTLNAGGSAYKAVVGDKLSKYLEDFATGLGAAKEGTAKRTLIDSNYGDIGKGFKDAVRFYNSAKGQIIAKMAEVGAGIATGIAKKSPTEGAGAYWIMKRFEPGIEALASKISEPITKKVLAPVILKSIETGSKTGLVDGIEYLGKAALGQTALNKAIQATIKGTTQKYTDYAMKDEDLNSAVDRFNTYFDNGGINQQVQDVAKPKPQAYAEGGQVEPKPVENGLSALYPDQHMMITTAKSRTANYLSQLRPQKPAGVPAFDNPYHDKQQEKSYRNAVGIAMKPLSVLKKVQDGTIKAEDVKHLTQMYPEVHTLLSRKLTEELMKEQVKGEKPNHKLLQGMSLLMGTALKSEMTPPGIQAAQSVFMASQPQQQQANAVGKRGKKNQNLLEKIPKQYQTDEQARDARANKD